MQNSDSTVQAGPLFFENLPAGFSFSDDPVESLLLREYGAMFVAHGVSVPNKIVFRDPEDVRDFQSGLTVSSAVIGDYEMKLQQPAMDALQAAILEAEGQSLSITSRGTDSAARVYEGTVELWASRVEPALDHWVGLEKITQSDADRIRAMSPFEQVPEVLKLEQEGIFFAKDLSKSIIYSVAPPGTSQHLSMLAFDVAEFENEAVRSILAKHGWHQTVVSDLPHFTYLGVAEDELSAMGLKKIMSNGRIFWVPDI